MEPQVQYAKTSDGVNIAFGVAGSGPPLVYVRTWSGTHVQLDWQQENPGKLYELLAANRTLITFDRRGAGLSDRNVSDLSLEKLTLDLEAVVDQLGLERFPLVGLRFGMMVSTIYALRHPERVSAIISLGGVMSGSAFRQSPRNRAMRAMRETDFDTYVETIAAISGNPRQNEIFRASITPEGQKAFANAAETFDVTDLIPQLKLPVLLLYPADGRDAVAGPGAFAREMAKRISGARLVVAPRVPLEAYWERVVSAIDAFLSDAPAQPASAAAAIHTILFTDLVSSTALTQRLGDAKAQELVRAHNTIVREALAAHGGAEIKHTGDGIMATFPTASAALECAVAIQRGVDRSPPPVGEGLGEGSDNALSIKIGLNAGEPVAEEQDLFGTSVQLARRICDHAETGQILVSNVVRELSAGKGFLFADSGDVALKGFEDPVRLYEVRWREQ